MSSLWTIKAIMSTRLFLETEIAAQESDGTWTPQPPDALPTGRTHSKAEAEQKAQSELWSELPGRWQPRVAILLFGTHGRLGGSPVGLDGFWKMNAAPKGPPLQEGAERGHRPPPGPHGNRHFPTRVNRHASPLEAKVSISKLVLGKLTWAVLPISPMWILFSPPRERERKRHGNTESKTGVTLPSEKQTLKQTQP